MKNVVCWPHLSIAIAVRVRVDMYTATPCNSVIVCTVPPCTPYSTTWLAENILQRILPNSHLPVKVYRGVIGTATGNRQSKITHYGSACDHFIKETFSFKLKVYYRSATLGIQV